MLRLAGFSSGRGDCARGGCPAGRCGSVAAFCVRLVTGRRFYWSVLRSITPAVCRLSAKQDGLRYVSFLFRRGSRSPFVRSRIGGVVIGICGFTLELCVFWRRSRRGTRGTENGVGGAALVRFCVGALALICFPRGSTLGLRAPNLRQRVFDSLDSLHWVRGKVRLCKTSQ